MVTYAWHEGIVSPAMAGAVSTSISVEGRPLIQELNNILEQLGTNIPQDLAGLLSAEIGRIMQDNIQAGGRPPWEPSWREKLTGGKTLIDTHELYDGLPSEPFEVTGNVLAKHIISRKNKDGNPLAATLVGGGLVFPLNTHQVGNKIYGMKFRKSEGGGFIFMPPNTPVHIPPRDFTTIPDEEAHRLLDIIEDYIEREKLRVGFTIVDSSHTPG